MGSLVDWLITSAARRWGIDREALAFEVRSVLAELTPPEALELLGRLEHLEHPPAGFARVGAYIDTTATDVGPLRLEPLQEPAPRPHQLPGTQVPLFNVAPDAVDGPVRPPARPRRR